MKTYHKSYGITASITDCVTGEAKLVARTADGKIVKNSIHKNRQAALAAWKRFSN